ncbi:SUMF1/EgtB/PvdO family nonheme iron enzyme [Pseudoalteromonas denitrificans]|uniref:Formylglycine-generating enzyme, required for sulfatase activity, contains SUMF1/FGE domain n=1 Tax=Pseudoalteromonas denitrificans DSM 6059 TaxID=1123010 RepID=A0A1I1R6N1_9GAMM|nr:formylglycine-generating enzyme family protein [Pseudoalteromonas denitrificans]SFD29969.1 Formylglycine-generating enzyme, required for sulfatase activity, contains SUMF1/FGE domain [Pseudoalteromonas denitrificans DSM 6059]
MRLTPLSLLISLSLLTFNSNAQNVNSVAGIKNEIAVKQTEFDSFSNVLNKHLKEESQQQHQLDLLRARSNKLEKEKKQALDAMNDVYRRMIEDPSLEITDVRLRYQKAVNSHKKNKEDIAIQLAAISAHRRDIEQIRISRHALLNTIEGLKEQKNSARVERLRNEFTRDGVLEINHTINCKRTETLAACEKRGQNLGMKKATKRFLDQVFSNLTEIRLVESKRSSSGAKVKVLNSHIVKSGFSGQGNYDVNLSVTMRGDVNNSRLCHLLNLDNRFCSDYLTTYQSVYEPEVSQPNNKVKASEVVVISEPYVESGSFEEDASKKKEINRYFELTLRSNVHDDEVFIDGVSFGSTRLVTKLPLGIHDIEVRKLGYKPYKGTVNLNKAQTLRVKLLKKNEVLESETIINNTFDGLPSSNMVVIPAGSFNMGDITGNGLANEKPVLKKTLNSSFSMDEKEVSVSQFDFFVSETNYTTEAEIGKGCAHYLNGEPVWESSLNWKNPGYAQQDDFPVVCLTYNDAKEYAQWLSEKTGNEYRLPNEVEWEYAARGGTETDYSWSNDIGSNLANCGWCGSSWSNVSSAPVGSFAVNQFGLYDMVGNVWEWTQKTSGQSDVAVRGGSWNFAPSLARASTRLILARDFRANYIGFRLVSER